MIRTITIENFKSIQKLELGLGRVNVLIGENGCGKTNILEAIAFAGAAVQDKLDNEFVAARGIRTTDPRFMRPAFQAEEDTKSDIRIDVAEEGRKSLNLLPNGLRGVREQGAMKSCR